MAPRTAQTSSRGFEQWQAEGYHPRGLDNCRVRLGILEMTQILLPLTKAPGDFALPRVLHSKALCHINGHRLWRG